MWNVGRRREEVFGGQGSDAGKGCGSSRGEGSNKGCGCKGWGCGGGTCACGSAGGHARGAHRMPGRAIDSVELLKGEHDGNMLAAPLVGGARSSERPESRSAGGAPWNSECVMTYPALLMETVYAAGPWDPRVPPGWFNRIPLCPCNVATLKAIAGTEDPKQGRLKVSQDPSDAVKTFHPGAVQCWRMWYSSDAAGNQCCFDRIGNLITSGPAAGTPDMVNPDNLLGHYTFDVKPFMDLGWREYHRRGWAPLSDPKCPSNPSL